MSGFTFTTPQQVAQSSAQQDAIQRARTLAQNPDLAYNPELLAQFSSSPNLEAAALVDATSRLRLANLAQDFVSMPKTDQNAAWQNIDGNTRDLLARHYGIGPAPDGGGGGLLGGIGRIVGVPLSAFNDHVLEPTVGAIPDEIRGGLKTGLDTTLQVLDVVGDQPAHLFRTTHKLFDDLGIDLNNPLVAGLLLGGIVLTGGAGATLLGGSLVGAGVGAGAGALAGIGAAGFGAAMLSGGPSRFVDAWHATANGESYFTRDALGAANELLAGDLDRLALAKEFAAGASPFDLASDQFDQGTSEWEELAQELVTIRGEQDIVDAVYELNLGKSSPGRWLADAFTPFAKGSTPYNIVSGASDAAFIIAADPFIVVGKTAKVSRAARLGISDGQDIVRRIDEMWESTRRMGVFGVRGATVSEGLRNSFGRIAKGFDGVDGSLAQLQQEMPQVTPLIDPIRTWAAETGRSIQSAEDIKDFFQHSAGVQELLRGKTSVRRDWIELPTLTRQGQRRLIARRDFWHDAIDFAADPEQQLGRQGLADLVETGDIWIPRLGVDAIPQNASKEQIAELVRTGVVDLSAYESDGISFLRRQYERNPLARVVFAGGRFNPVRATGKLAQGLTRQVPFGGNVIDLYGSTGTQDMLNLVEVTGMMGHMPNTVKRAWADYFMNADEGARRLGIAAFLDGVMKMSNVAADDASRAYVDRISHIIAGRGNAYMSGEQTMALLREEGGLLMSSGVMVDSDLATKIRVPNFKELLAVSRKYHWTRRAHGYANPQLLYRAMDNVWKPSVLLRIGFIPRAAGEELAATLMRYPSALWVTKAARFAADEIEYNESGQLTGGGLLPIARRLQARTQGRAVTKVDDAGQRLTRAQRTWTRGYNWDDTSRELTDIAAMHQMLTDGSYRRHLFSNHQGPLAERIAVYTTMSARHMLRQAMNQTDTASGRALGRFGLDSEALLGARSLLSVENPEKFGSLNELTSQIDGLFVGRQFGSDLASRRAFAEEVDIVQTMLESGGAPAAAHINGVMSVHSTAGELEAGIGLRGQNDLIKADEAANLGVGTSSKVVVMRGEDWSQLAAGDPMFQLGYYGAVTRFMRKDRLGRAMAQRGVHFVNPSVRSELAESAVAAGNWDSTIQNLHRALWDTDTAPTTLVEEGRYKFLRYLADPDNSLWRNEAREVLEDIANPAFKRGGAGSNFKVPDAADIEAWVDDVGQLSSDARGTLAGLLHQRELQPFIESLEELRNELHSTAVRLINSSDFTDHVRRHDRMKIGSISGQRVANPIPDGQFRIYMPMVHTSFAESFYRLPQAQRQLVTRSLIEKGWDRDTVFAMFGPAQQGADLITPAMRQMNGEFLPLRGMGFADYDDAARFTSDFNTTMSNYMGDEVLPTPDTVFPGYVDVLERDIRAGVSGGGATRLNTGASKSEVFHVNHELFGRMHRFGESPVQVMNGNVVEGITQEQAIEEWADMITLRFEQVLMSDDGTEVLPALMGHNFTLNADVEDAFNASFFDARHIQDTGERLPKIVNAPAYGFQEKGSLWQRAIDRGFNDVITPAIDSIARQPLYTMEYIKAFRAARGNLNRLRDPQLVSTVVADVEAMASMPLRRRLDFATLTDESVDELNLALRDPRFASAHRAIPEQEYTGLSAELAEDFEAARNVMASLSRADSKFRRAGEILDEVARHAEDADLETVLRLYRQMGQNRWDSWNDFKRAMTAHDGSVPWQLRNLNHRQWRSLEELAREDFAIRSQVNTIAAERAFRAAIPYVDDRRLRSQFQEWMHNYIPFHFAEEQFIKRWVRTFVDSPESIRRMQLIYNGMKSSGMVIQDPERGDDVFVMPGSAQATAVVAELSGLIFGQEARVPIAMPMTGSLKFSVPGLDSLGVPSPGPALAIPLAGLTSRFPELQGVLDKAPLGMERAENRSIYEVLVPASVRRFARATVLWDPDNRLHAHHTMRAMQYLSANGYAPDENASALEQQEYIERVQNWARSLALTEAIYGFVAPASPSAGSIITGDAPLDPFQRDNWQAAAGISVDDINQIPRPRFLDFLKSGMDWDEAIDAFIAEEGVDATAWTIFETQGQTGRALPATSDTFDWLTENTELMRAYTLAGAWLIPHGDRNDAFDWKAYNEQLALDLRVRKGTEEFYEDIHFAAAVPQYEEIRQAHQDRLADIELLPEGNERTQARLAENDRWRFESEQFQSMHPIFWEHWRSGEGQVRRQRTLDEWQALRDDSRFQQSDRFQVLDGLWEIFQLYKAQRQQLTGRRGSQVDRFRNDLEDRARVSMESYVRNNPEAREFYISVIRPEAF